MKGKISIGRVDCGDSENYMSIRVCDDTSDISFLDVKVSLKDFMNALAGLTCQPATYTLRGLDRVGKKYEHKQVIVEVPLEDGKFLPTDAAIHTAIANIPEVAGWTCSLGKHSDFKTMHRYMYSDDPKIYKCVVRFKRWV